MPEFEAFPKIARLNRGMVISEKIDGTNACVVILALGELEEGYNAPSGTHTFVGEVARAEHDGLTHVLFAQSRKRLLALEQDNFGFAAWVRDHADELVQLGEGRHFGEWWGLGIQRGYGLSEKRFSLFNSSRWKDSHRADNPEAIAAAPPCCHVVPILATSSFSQETIDAALVALKENGSAAAPGYMNPEGVVVYLSAARQMFKVTLKDDQIPKSVAERLAA
jgi:hypothetical protein